ncbi:MAG: acyl carrier protein [Nitrospirae bacterium]|nr:acyl carrier protein [Nitrospirota bacterium]
MADNVEKEIVFIISEVSGFDEDEITPEKNFFKDLEVDSIKAIEITVALEKKFKVSVRDEDVPKITTVKEAVALINKLLDQKSSGKV